VGKLANTIPHLMGRTEKYNLEHSLQIFLNEILENVNEIASEEDYSKITPALLYLTFSIDKKNFSKKVWEI
jgi:hypothetical protein